MNSSFKANSLIFQFILILILTLINAFFSASEMAIVSLNKNKIKVLAEEGNKNAILIERLLQEPTKFLSTVQVGITLASFFSSASAATGISNVFGNSLETLNIPYAHEISLIVVTIILSYITLVFGELLPKRLALQNSQKIAEKPKNLPQKGDFLFNHHIFLGQITDFCLCLLSPELFSAISSAQPPNLLIPRAPFSLLPYPFYSKLARPLPHSSS